MKNYFFVFCLIFYLPILYVNADIISAGDSIGTIVAQTPTTATVTGAAMPFYSFSDFTPGGRTITFEYSSGAPGVIPLFCRSTSNGENIDSGYLTANDLSGNNDPARLYFITQGTLTLGANFSIDSSKIQQANFGASTLIRFPNGNIYDATSSGAPVTGNNWPLTMGGGNYDLYVNGSTLSSDYLSFMGKDVNIQNADLTATTTIGIGCDTGLELNFSNYLLQDINGNTYTVGDSDFHSRNSNYTAAGAFIVRGNDLHFSGENYIETVAGVGRTMLYAGGEIKLDDTEINSNNILISAQDDIHLGVMNTSFCEIYTGEITGSAEPITITSASGDIHVYEDTFINSGSEDGGSAGDITIEATSGRVIFYGENDVHADCDTNNAGGDVLIRGNAGITVANDFSYEFINTFSASGISGTVQMLSNSGAISLSNSDIVSGTQGVVVNDTQGNVTINARDAILLDNSDITTTSATDSGSVDITSSNSNVRLLNSVITTGRSGDVVLDGLTGVMVSMDTPDIAITTSSLTGDGSSLEVYSQGNITFDQSGIRTVSQAAIGDGGSVTIETIGNAANTITFTGSAAAPSTIDTRALGNNTANGGYVSLYSTGSVNFTNNNITTYGFSTAGNVDIDSENANIVFANSNITTGSIGDVEIISSGKIDFNTSSDISTTSSDDDSGTVKIQSTNNEVSFNASTIATGNVGHVDIDARNDISFTNGANINSSTVDDEGGDVTIDTTIGSVTFTSSTIQTQGPNQGGLVAINAVDAITFSSGAHITTGSTTTTAGTVTINSSTNQVSFSNSNITTGASGNVAVAGETGISFNAASITTQTSIAAAGTVALTSKGNINFTTSNVNANGLAGSTNGGAVTVQTTTGTSSITFISSAINSSTAGTGSGGNVNISAPGLISFSNASNIITTGTTTAGDVNPRFRSKN